MAPLWRTPKREAILHGIQLVQTGGCALGEHCREDGALRDSAGCGMIKRLGSALVAQLGPPAGAAWVAKAALAIPDILSGWTPADRMHLPEEATRALISGWIAADRDERSDMWRRAQRHMHASPPPPKRWHKEDPAVYKVVSVGVNAFTQHRCAKVALTGLPVVLWVDLHGIAMRVGKNAWKRQARRQGTLALPKEAHDRIRSALRPYLG